MDSGDVFLPPFEFDERKSRINRLKHGIDFAEAQALWLDESLTELQARNSTEPRFIMIGRIDGKHWTAVVTYRGDAVRLISVCRSRAKEVEMYGCQ
jgi:uncharacterized DUF497 family protein